MSTWIVCRDEKVLAAFSEFPAARRYFMDYVVCSIHPEGVSLQEWSMDKKQQELKYLDLVSIAISNNCALNCAILCYLIR